MNIGDKVTLAFYYHMTKPNKFRAFGGQERVVGIISERISGRGCFGRPTYKVYIGYGYPVSGEFYASELFPLSKYLYVRRILRKIRAVKP
jgi:hypothetical protein